MSIDLSLNRLVKLLPDLPYTRPTLHVAGTNGKGSVSALLSSILLSSVPPLRAGRFNSPHLVSVLDCITLDDRPVDAAGYRHARKQVEDADCLKGTKLTEFELLTMTALRVFENERVDVVVLEVGMGGRLDATNVVPDECILASALAAVDLDHQAFLGDTVALITREKAGIARAGKPFVLGFQTHPEVEDVVKDVLSNVGGLLVPALEVLPEEKEVSWCLLDLDPSKEVAPPPQPITVVMRSFQDPLRALLPLHGAHQLDNLGTALGVIDALLSRADHDAAVVSLDLKTRISPETVVQGIQNVKWPGRLSFHTLAVPISGPTTTSFTTKPETEFVDLVVLADGAHNPASAKTLGAYITHLLSYTRSTSVTSAQQPPDFVSVPITYILSLSLSPPKTPLQTLSPILPPTVPTPRLHPTPPPTAIHAVQMGASTVTSSGSDPELALPTFSNSVNVGVGLVPLVSVALLRFTPPEAMPWVKSVPPKEMEEAVRALMPDLSDGDIWVSPEPENRANDGAAGDSGAGEPDALKAEKGEERNRALEDALRWAAGKHVKFQQLRTGGEDGYEVEEEKKKGRGLVVLAGSLYLVADFYRLLERGF